MTGLPSGRGRKCDQCGTRMPFGRRRNRVGEQFLCDGCTEGKPGWPGRPIGMHGAKEAGLSGPAEVWVIDEGETNWSRLASSPNLTARSLRRMRERYSSIQEMEVRVGTKRYDVEAYLAYLEDGASMTPKEAAMDLEHCGACKAEIGDAGLVRQGALLVCAGGCQPHGHRAAQRKVAGAQCMACAMASMNGLPHTGCTGCDCSKVGHDEAALLRRNRQETDQMLRERFRAVEEGREASKTAATKRTDELQVGDVVRRFPAHEPQEIASIFPSGEKGARIEFTDGTGANAGRGAEWIVDSSKTAAYDEDPDPAFTITYWRPGEDGEHESQGFNRRGEADAYADTLAMDGYEGEVLDAGGGVLYDFQATARKSQGGLIEEGQRGVPHGPDPSIAIWNSTPRCLCGWTNRGRGKPILADHLREMEEQGEQVNWRSASLQRQAAVPTYYEVVVLHPGDEAPLREWGGTDPRAAMEAALGFQAGGAVRVYIMVGGTPIWVDGELTDAGRRGYASLRTVAHDSGDGETIYHCPFCFAGNVRYLTRDGIKSFAETAGTSQWVLTADPDQRTAGRWVQAEIKEFGEQPLMKVTLRRNKRTRIIEATPEHRWLVKSDKRVAGAQARSTDRDVLTRDLRPGQRLSYLRAPGLPEEVSLDASGVRHGIVFGDGSAQGKTASVSLWGEKDKQLLQFFSDRRYKDVNTSDRVLGTGVPGVHVTGDLWAWMKALPDTDDQDYLYGWLAGYFAADGTVSKQGQVIINSANLAHLEAVQDIALRLGITTYGIRRQMRVGFPGREPSALYGLEFVGSTLREDFFLIEEHRDRFRFRDYGFERIGWTVVSVETTTKVETVYCAVVPGTHTFALEDNIWVGNCGAGQVTARSDGTAECGFCETVFTVQVQPKHPSMPQTIDGVPVDDPSMPGNGQHEDPSPATQVPAEPGPEGFAPAGAGGPEGFLPAGTASRRTASAPEGYPDTIQVDCENCGQRHTGEFHHMGEWGEGPIYDVVCTKDWFEDFYTLEADVSGVRRAVKVSSTRYRTATGAALDEDAYLRHLAIAFADDKDAAIGQVRASRMAASVPPAPGVRVRVKFPADEDGPAYEQVGTFQADGEFAPEGEGYSYPMDIPEGTVFEVLPDVDGQGVLFASRSRSAS